MWAMLWQAIVNLLVLGVSGAIAVLLFRHRLSIWFDYWLKRRAETNAKMDEQIERFKDYALILTEMTKGGATLDTLKNLHELVSQTIEKTEDTSDDAAKLIRTAKTIGLAIVTEYERCHKRISYRLNLCMLRQHDDGLCPLADEKYKELTEEAAKLDRQYTFGKLDSENIDIAMEIGRVNALLWACRQFMHADSHEEFPDLDWEYLRTLIRGVHKKIETAIVTHDGCTTH